MGEFGSKHISTNFSISGVVCLILACIRTVFPAIVRPPEDVIHGHIKVIRIAGQCFKRVATLIQLIAVQLDCFITPTISAILTWDSFTLSRKWRSLCATSFKESPPACKMIYQKKPIVVQPLKQHNFREENYA
jgi:hypothetical protein